MKKPRKASARTGGPVKNQDRRDRLAEALRANLRKRKEQARARADALEGTIQDHRRNPTSG
jgi:hypothetical protein